MPSAARLGRALNLEYWNQHLEYGPASNSALHANPPPQAVDDALNGGEPKSATQRFGRVKRVEDPKTGRLFDTAAGVCNLQADILAR